MAYEGLATRRGEQSLAPLVEKSVVLDRVHDQLVVLDKVPVPVNEFGIPIPQILVQDVLATLATRHIWTGGYDVHHIAWPEIDYRRVNERTDSHTGGLYRGAAALKVRMPRQLHNYIHAVSEPPAIPSDEVMRQWSLEQRQIDRLYDTVRLANMSEFDIPEEEREQYRFSNYLQKLEEMQDGQLGLMPEIDFLADLEIDTARRTLRALARVRGISNARRSRRVFFDAAKYSYAS